MFFSGLSGIGIGQLVEVWGWRQFPAVETMTSEYVENIVCRNWMVYCVVSCSAAEAKNGSCHVRSCCCFSCPVEERCHSLAVKMNI